MEVKRYNGSGWDTVAGLGAQGAAATSSTIATWVKTASGGETTLSGNDDNSVSLSYTAGQELLYINGVLQKRAVDYVASTGTTITGLNALVAGDVVTVWTVNAFSVTNAIPNSTITAKGNLIVGTGTGTYTAQTVGTDGQVLTANSAQADGVEWATPTVGGMTLLSTTTLSGSTNTISSISGAYTDLRLVIVDYLPSDDNGSCSLRVNTDTGNNYSTATAFGQGSYTMTDSITLGGGLDNVVNDNLFIVSMPMYSQTAAWKAINVNSVGVDSTAGTAIRVCNNPCGYKSTSAISSVTIFKASGTMTGTAYIYGVK
jgi:hypothetical protein